jgi:cation transport regulator ChaB
MPKGDWIPPDAGKDAPQEIKDILNAVYSDYRDKHPAEDPAVKAAASQIAWGAVHNAGWEKDPDTGKWEKKPKKESAFEGTISAFRLVESADKSTSLIDVHVIAPGWGSSGYYSPDTLKEACKKRVYPEGMHMHLDHPTREAAKNQPARTISGESPLAAIFTEDGHYEEKGWDGPGVYTKARVLPKYVEDIRAMAGHIGISHYVDGISEQGEADGKKGPIIKELRASPLNTVDFVTVPGAAGHYRTMFSEMKVRTMADPTENDRLAEEALPWDECIAKAMDEYGDEDTAKKVCAAIKNGTVQHAVAAGIAPNVSEARKIIAEKIRTDPLFSLFAGAVQESTNKKRNKMAESKQESLTLTEIRSKNPEVITELKEQIREELKIETATKDQGAKLTEAAGKIKTLEQKIKEQAAKLAEVKAREYVTAEVVKAKLPETSGKILTDALVPQVIVTEDGSIDAVLFGKIVSEAIKAKADEIAAIRKEAGIKGNGGGNPTEDRKHLAESFEEAYLRMGKTPEQAKRLAESAAGGR